MPPGNGRVGLKPTEALHLSGSCWKDAALRVLASVKVHHTSSLTYRRSNAIAA